MGSFSRSIAARKLQCNCEIDQFDRLRRLSLLEEGHFLRRGRQDDLSSHLSSTRRSETLFHDALFRTTILSMNFCHVILYFNTTPMVAVPPGGGGTWVFFGWACAARDSKLAPRSKKKIPLKLIPRSRNGPIFYTPF